MCSIFLIGIGILYKKSQITPFLSFVVTFSFLFIGGRFWALLISPGESMFDLQGATFLIREEINTSHFVSTLNWVICFFIFSILGYVLKKKRTSQIKKFDNRRVCTILNVIYWPLAIFSLLGKAMDFKYALDNGGYLAMYEGQNETYTSFSSLGTILMYVFWGMAFTFGDKSLKRRYLILLLLFAVITILIGSRGMFGSFLMFMFYIYSLNKKVNIFKILLIGGVAVSLLLFIFTFSIREMGASDLTGGNVLSAFLYEQGVTFLVFDKVREISNYPVVGYFQAFIPGATSIYTHLINPNAYPYDLTFDAYISNTLNPERFASGNGVGWSILGDFYVFSFGNIFVFSVLSALFGAICAYVENLSSIKPFYSIVIYSLFFKFMILPRSGLNTIIPFLWYVAILYIIVIILSKSLSRKATIGF
jgi:oligosaccharide repeat unit polymerase